ncbi:MAG: zinc ABC transporter substrate-binding protein [Gammaproteobacteria bacterium]|jgi:zinc/manganese transport system substrate-binding protein|nr:zinc ABC transporter substrate-binding protein [Gammaproteobacteria bacterium]
MKTIGKVIAVLLIAMPLTALVIKPASAGVDVFACEPEWGALAKTLGGDLVSVYTATTAYQDPHQIQARPSLIAKLRRADLLVCTGSQLEIGWLPVLLRQAGNRRVQPGQPGNFAATEYVTMLDKPVSVDRAQGDVHPGGNPHIQTDPRNMALVAKALADRLAQIDPPHAVDYAARYKDFDAQWQTALVRWEQQAAPLRGVKVVVHHKAWSYLFAWLGIESVASLEAKPGVPPSAGHLSEVVAQLRNQPAKMVIRAAYQDGRPDEWLAEHVPIRVVVLPFTVGGSDAAADLFGLYDDTITNLLEGAK